MQGARYEPGGQGWIRTTVLGLLVTGGLTNAGDPVDDDDENGAEGLHGRLSNLGATNVWADGAWEGDDYRMWVQGRVRQALLYGENLELVRRIETALGSSTIEIHDTVTNLGHRPQHMMILYHMNPGHPLLDEGARLHVRSRSRRFHDAYPGATEQGWDGLRRPSSADWQVQVMIHDVRGRGGRHRPRGDYQPWSRRRAGPGLHLEQAAAAVSEPLEEHDAGGLRDRHRAGQLHRAGPQPQPRRRQPANP